MNSKDQYIEQLKLKLDEWNAEIDELDAKARKSQAQAKQKLESRLVDLKEKRVEFQAKLAQLQDASADTWETLKAGTEILLDDLRQTLAESKDAFVKGMEEAKSS